MVQFVDKVPPSIPVSQSRALYDSIMEDLKQQPDRWAIVLEVPASAASTKRATAMISGLKARGARCTQRTHDGTLRLYATINGK